MPSSFSLASLLSTINSSVGAYFAELLTLSLPEFIIKLFADFGWIIVLILFIQAIPIIYLNYRQAKTMAKQHFILLAIDVPRDNEQTVKAAENFITALSGMHSPISWREKWIKADIQLAFSLEIVSIDGHVQFLIRLPHVHRDLVEAAIQTQYPDAEITEVEDYTKEFPSRFPDEKYKWKGGTMGYVKPDAIPIKTYEDFEDKLDSELKDPLALFLENMSRLEKGEQAWFQIVVRPTGFDWLSMCDKEVDKILGKKSKSKETWLSKMVSFPGKIVGAFAETIFGYQPSSGESSSDPKKMMDLTPAEKTVVEAIHNKKGKMGFYCKIRLLYLGERSVFKPWRLGALIGSIKQYNSNVKNGLRPYFNKYGTGSDYYFEWRRKRKLAYKQNLIMGYYKRRDAYNGRKLNLMTSDELASLFHFPNTKAMSSALLKRTESKKGEAPVDLPVASSKEMREETKTADQNVVEDWEDMDKVTFEVDNDYFEERFAKDKDAYKKKQAARKEKERIEELKAEAQTEEDSGKEDISENKENKDEKIESENQTDNKAEVENKENNKQKDSVDENTEVAKVEDDIEPPKNLPI